MTGRFRAAGELGLSCIAVIGCVLSWLQARTVVVVAPIAAGQPETLSAVYDPQLLLLSLVLAMTAGVLMVLGAARLWRARQ
ncbi:MAG: hypothetical protein K2Q25_10095 [Mycobacteriaceae bacterium]|nr:hypothetical protein [Mycobacteriaceae bacterium]